MSWRYTSLSILTPCSRKTWGARPWWTVNYGPARVVLAIARLFYYEHFLIREDGLHYQWISLQSYLLVFIWEKLVVFGAFKPFGATMSSLCGSYEWFFFHMEVLEYCCTRFLMISSSWWRLMASEKIWRGTLTNRPI